MQTKILIAAIITVTAALITATTVVTVQSVDADTCSPKSTACVFHDSGCSCTVASTNHGNTRASGESGVVFSHGNAAFRGGAFCSGGQPGVIKNGHTICAG